MAMSEVNQKWVLGLVGEVEEAAALVLTSPFNKAAEGSVKTLKEAFARSMRSHVQTNVLGLMDKEPTRAKNLLREETNDVLRRIGNLGPDRTIQLHQA